MTFSNRPKNFLSPLLLIGCLLSAPLTSQTATAPPRIRYMAGEVSQTPIWVDLEAATLPNGAIDWTLFTSSDKSTLELPMDADPATGECRSFLGEPSDGRIDGKASDSLPDLLANSIAIYSGVVESARPGFYTGLPYTLLTIRVARVLQGSEWVPNERIDVPYPFAQFSIGAQLFCTRTAIKSRPAKGTRVIVFLFDPPIDRTGSIAPIKSEQLLFEDNTGQLAFSPQLATAGWLQKARFEDLEGYVEHSLAGANAP